MVSSAQLALNSIIFIPLSQSHNLEFRKKNLNLDTPLNISGQVYLEQKHTYGFSLTLLWIHVCLNSYSVIHLHPLYNRN